MISERQGRTRGMRPREGAHDCLSWVFVVRPLGFEPRTCGLSVGFSPCQPVLTGVV